MKVVHQKILTAAEKMLNRETTLLVVRSGTLYKVSRYFDEIRFYYRDNLVAVIDRETRNIKLGTPVANSERLVGYINAILHRFHPLQTRIGIYRDIVNLYYQGKRNPISYDKSPNAIVTGFTAV